MPSVDGVSAIAAVKGPEKKSNSDNVLDLAEFLGNEDNYLEVDMG